MTDHPYSERRSRVLEALGERGAMVVPAAPEVVVGRDVELRYVPDADLLYLTGYAQPEAVAVLAPAADAPFTLFVRDRDPREELWTGPREEPEAVAERVGADLVAPVSELGDLLPGLLRTADRIHFRIGTGRQDVEALVLDILGSGRAARQRSGRGPVELVDPGPILDEMRLVKDPDEVAAIRHAVALTVDAFRDAFRSVRPAAGEWAVEAALEAAFRRAGADGPAFPTIAASGPNATVLHYTANRRVMQSGELLLLDGGARLAGYNADLTRTVPVDGFSDPARELYDIVLAAHDAATAAVRPGATLQDVHATAVRVLLTGLVDLGILDGDPESMVDDESTWKPFFPHTTSHWLGLDVHDVGTYSSDGRHRALQPGMVITVEPGLYFAPASAHGEPSPAAPFRGIGIRIENDILVTDDGAENLSAALPTSPDQLTALVGSP